MTEEQYFPFTAIVGQRDVKDALLANAVHPGIGGVLVSGTRGTAKSTAVRSLANLLPRIEAVSDCPYNCPPDDPERQCERCAGRELADRPDLIEERRTPFVTLPIGATEDRVLGTIDLEAAIQDGERSFEPGLLARANRGILYVDEVNLLGDHLVDVLLDAIASGTNRVEREGVSVEHPADAMLVGTMNPEEGELRPQLLDRFGLAVEVDRTLDAEDRKAVVRRRTKFDEDPEGMMGEWATAERELADRVAAARDRFPSVTVAEDALDRIVTICTDHDVDGLRADVIVHRTARALAALDGLEAVDDAHVTRAAELALGHRANAKPSPDSGGPGSSGDRDSGDDSTGNRCEESPSEDRPGRDGFPPNGEADVASDEDASDAEGSANDEDEAADQDGMETADGDRTTGDRDDGGVDDAAVDGSDPEAADDGPQGPGGAEAAGGAEDPGGSDSDGRAAEERVFPVTDGIEPPCTSPDRRLELPDADGGRGRSRATTSGPRGAYRRARRPAGGAADGELALDATVRTAAPAQPARRAEDARDLAFALRPEDLRVKERRSHVRNLVVFVVDASGSMGAFERMSAVKGAILSLLEDAYQQRDYVSLIGFRESGAETLLSPTPSVGHAARELAELPTGGRTPLAAGLERAHRLVRSERRTASRLAPLLVLVSDGHTNYEPSDDAPIDAAMAKATQLRRADVPAVCFDTETGQVRLGIVQQLAERMGARYYRFDDLEPGRLSATVRDVFDGDAVPGS